MIRFRQKVEVRCSAPNCKATIEAKAYFEVGPDKEVKFLWFTSPKESGWREGRYIPGILHPSRGGVPKKGVTYREPGPFVFCPVHVKEFEDEEAVGLGEEEAQPVHPAGAAARTEP